jgi:two-component system heavy metal sensor histidine kinase CusS
VTTPAVVLRRAAIAVRRSLAAQVSLAIALVSVLIILFFGTLLDSFIARELREKNEALLLSNLAFIRDDAAAANGDRTAIERVIERAGRRTHWLHAAAYDEATGALLAKSQGSIVPLHQFPPQAVGAEVLPPDANMAQLDGVRRALVPATVIWEAPDGRRYRLMRGRIGKPGRAMTVTLAIETTPTRELRMSNWGNVQTALWGAAALATLFGMWIARRILASVRRFGATASRINALDLRERLTVEDTPTELVESAVAFNRMLDRLQQAIDRLSAFSSELAHDLRTPIGNLLGEAQVALSRPRSAQEYRAVLESAVEEYERISRMTSNMLFLARADNHNDISPQWVDVDAALARVMGYFELLAEERGVSLRSHFDTGSAEPHRVWADETMLVRALSNLVSNALRHAAPKTPVVLSANVEPDGACTLRVANEGTPIAPEHQPRIFGRFYRIDASRQGSASGSGLGLAIVRSIMDLHHGSVGVASAPGAPTVFTLHFPAPTDA